MNSPPASPVSNSSPSLPLAAAAAAEDDEISATSARDRMARFSASPNRRFSASSSFFCCISTSATVPRFDFGTNSGLDADTGIAAATRPSDSSEEDEEESDEEELSLDAEEGLPIDEDEPTDAVRRSRPFLPFSPNGATSLRGRSSMPRPLASLFSSSIDFARRFSSGRIFSRSAIPFPFGTRSGGPNSLH